MEPHLVYDSIKPMFYASLPFAFHLHTLTSERKTFTHVFVPNVIYNAAFLVAYFYAYVHCTVLTPSVPMGPASVLLGTVNNFDMQFEFALSLFIVAASWCNADSYFKLLEEIGKTDKRLRELEVKTPSTKWFSYAICVSTLGLMLLIIVIRVFFRRNELYTVSLWTYMVLFHLPKLIGFIGLNHFVALLAILKSRFKAVNDHLASLNVSTPPTFLFQKASGKVYPLVNHIPLVLTPRNDKAQFYHNVQAPTLTQAQFKAFNKIGNRPFELSSPAQHIAATQAKTPLHISSLAAVRSLKLAHDALCDRASELNVLFSVSTLLLVTSAFIRTTNELNNCARTLIDIAESGFDGMRAGFLYTNFSMVCLTLGHLVLMAAVCSFTNAEANYTPVLVHKLMTRTNDHRMTKELETFSLQLLHRRVQFTACGFFPLDATILFAVVGGVTTYLIILIQFQLAKV